MSSIGHKCKRSIEDTPINLSKMRLAQVAVESLKEELEGIQETEGALERVITELEALENILHNTKKPVLVSRLLAQRKDTGFEEVCKKLSLEMSDIYAHVNMVVLDAVLRTLWTIAADDPHTTDDESPMLVSVLPELKLPMDGIKFVSPATGREIWLTGSVDYCVTRYPNLRQNKERMLALSSMTLNTILRVTLMQAHEQIVLIEAKRVDEKALLDYIPEAVGQAMALSRFLGLEEMRFVLTDGISWVFCILSKDDNQMIFYQSVPVVLPKHDTTQAAPQVLLLLSEWGKPLPPPKVQDILLVRSSASFSCIPLPM
ncbi:uncharacterized protein EI90DRAFT_2967439 [Cantharellus anzutake]|uniref:uncharacterized protein n=1 Tax=Cantharellus anzutake TaxID=1750568 RepID=UPI001908B2BD|nr:uncharacterized protein EI90DRAFT_2967439 [Cantharellus anzutake]KAF8338972.1 hypothetical protein EI90DRAFT_2967439 [Cantharellus anzutake]